jgi:hypothetical protein
MIARYPEAKKTLAQSFDGEGPTSWEHFHSNLDSRPKRKKP